MLSEPAAQLPWLSVQSGRLCDAAGASVRLCGLRGAPGDDADAELRDVAWLLEPLGAGRRVVAVTLDHVAQLKPEALAMLDRRIERLAAAGAYTLLRIAARLWMHGHHLRLARHYAQHSAVLFALLGRAPLAERLWRAAQALLAERRAGLVWLPLESAHAALRAEGGSDIGLLWDAARPQAPGGIAMRGAARRPLLLDGWLPGLHPLADLRLMRLCSEGGIGWLARSDGDWMGTQRGLAVPTRSARALRHALQIDIDATGARA